MPAMMLYFKQIQQWVLLYDLIVFLSLISFDIEEKHQKIIL
jgi:hypothetical protein